MSFNVDGSTNNSVISSIANFKCDTIQGLSNPNLVTINSQLNINSALNVTGITNIANKLNFSFGSNSIDMYGLGTINNVNHINPSPNTPLTIDDGIGNTQVQINHTNQPGLVVSANDNTTNWISIQCKNTIDDTSLVFGSINGNATFGAHNAALSAWKDIYCQSTGNLNIGLASNIEKVNVVGNIRSDTGSFYKGVIDQFRFKKSTLIGGPNISITSTTYVLLSRMVYLGLFFGGNISKIYVSADPNNNQLSFRVIDEITTSVICERLNVTGTINLFDLLTISNLGSGGTVLGLYSKVNTGTANWSSMLALYDN